MHLSHRNQLPIADATDYIAFCEATDKALIIFDREVYRKDIRENGEPMVDIGSGIRVRHAVAERIEAANLKLAVNNLILKVFEGWRSQEAQLDLRKKALDQVRSEYPGCDQLQLEALASKYAAPLSIAPHCTGGAIDITICRLSDMQELNMGTQYCEFERRSYTAYPGIDDIARGNRDLLKSTLESQGFFNIPTEWWHYSYGNTEWATHVGSPYAIYGPV